jgi:putative nucleotidyltransferase with HDIG domain
MSAPASRPQTSDHPTHSEEAFPWLRLDDLSIPMLPDQAHHVMQLAGDPEVTVTTLAAVVSKDPVLATRVLGLANSALFGAMTALRSVQDAVVRLGVVRVRNAVVAASMDAQVASRDIYGTESQRFMDHAVGTAYLARLLAERQDVDVEELFLCGLLHDIGKLVILKTAHVHVRGGGQPIAPDELAAAIAHYHAACGALALHFWKLPDDVLDVVRHHHDYTLAADPARAAIGYAANRLSHRYGFGCPPEGDGVADDPVMDLLSLDEQWLEMTDAHAPGLFNAARQAFG